MTVRLGDENDLYVELGRMWSLVKMEKCLKHLVVVVVVANHFREMNLS